MRPRSYFLLLCIILLGFGLRLHALAAVPLRGDEAFSVQYWADSPLSYSLTEIAPGEPHTPLVYVIGRLWWHIIGGADSVFALRYLSVLGNIIGASAIFALGWRLSGGRSVGLLCALLWALHPFEIWHSQEFRSYAYWAGLSVMALWLGLRLVDKAGAARRADWALYAAIGGFAALSLYTELFSTLAVTGFALWTGRRDWKFLRRLLALQSIFALLVLAAFLLVQVSSGFASAYPGLVQPFAAADYFTRFVPTLALGSTIPLDEARLGLALSLLFAAILLLLYRAAARPFYFVLLVAALPLTLLGVVSQRYNLFHPRYVLSVAPAFMLLLALGSFYAAAYLRRIWEKTNQSANTGFALPSPKLRGGAGAGLESAPKHWARLCLYNALPVVLLLPWFALVGLTLDAHFNNPAFRRAPAWDELGAFLNAQVQEEDLVIQLAGDVAFGYYYDKIAKDIALPVNSAQSAADIEDRLRALQNQGFKSIYIAAKEQAGWPNAGVVESWLQANMQETLRTNAAGMPIQQYRPWIVTEQFDGELARFEGIVALRGFDFSPEPLPTGELLLWLYWQPLARSAQPLKSFAHVYAADSGQLWTQDDQFPQGPPAGFDGLARWRNLPRCLLSAGGRAGERALSAGGGLVRAGFWRPPRARCCYFARI